MTTITDESLEILSNVEIIAINQDPLGEQGTCRLNCNSTDQPQVWAVKLSGGDYAAVVVNWNDTKKFEDFTFNLAHIGLEEAEEGDEIEVKDLVDHFSLGRFKLGQFNVGDLDVHVSRTFRIRIVKAQTGEGVAKFVQ